jgi:predicted XRE-type DNA-binding protein
VAIWKAFARASFASIWEAVEDTPEDAANLRLRSEAMIAIRQILDGWRLTQAEAAARLGLTQPRLNDLLRGRIQKFSLDALVTIAARAGLTVRLDLAKPRRKRATPPSPRRAA